MRAFRVWSTWSDDPESDGIASKAFELEARAQAIADRLNAEREPVTKPRLSYVVRSEEIPRDIMFQGSESRVVMCVLGDDTESTDVSGRG